MTNTAQTSKVDRDNATIHDVVVLQQDSVNGNVYSEQAMQDVARLMQNGHLINLGHKNGSGKYLAGLGKAFKPYMRDGKLYAGEVKLKPKHPNTEMILDDAESDIFNDTLALSIEVLKGKSRGVENFTSHSQNGKRVVDRINNMQPFALVQNGGTNSGLFEQSGLFEEDENDMSKITNEAELRAAYPALVATIEQESRDKYAADKEQSFAEEKKPLTDRIAELESEVTELKVKLDVETKKVQDFVDAASEDEKIDAVKAKAEEKGIPAGTITEETFQELANCSDDLIEQLLDNAVPKQSKGYGGGRLDTGSYKPKSRSKTRDILEKHKKQS